MPRAERIQFPGCWYHVFNRGARRQAVFVDDSDRSTFLQLVAATAERYGIEIHTYCLMGNHYHLLVRTPDPNIAVAMQWLISRYTHAFNTRHGHDGALFRGRYHSVVVDADAYLITVHRYIHRNPLAAGMVTDLTSYKWSSYPAFLGLEPRPTWLELEPLSGLAGCHNPAAYRVVVETGGPNAELQRFYEQRCVPPVLGSKEFEARVIGGLADDHPERRAS